MKITLITVGKTDVKWVKEGLELYAGRLSHYIQFTINEIPELKNASALSRDQIKEKEGDLILGLIRPADDVILLDEHGKELRSVEFAAWMEKQRHASRRLVFVIGGPYGFAESVYRRSDDMISMSRMTFSHQMIRLIFTEQLYRACTIIKGEPYHHE